MLEIWFWQLIISPHMSDLAVALVRLGHKVTYVVQREMSEERARQGWLPPSLPGVKLQVANSNEAVQHLAKFAPGDSIHVCQGVRANGLISLAQRILALRGLRQWSVMETVNDTNWLGVLKRLEYDRIFKIQKEQQQGILATGYRTTDWIVARGMPKDKVYPFAYFLPKEASAWAPNLHTSAPFRFLFAGRLVPLKRVNWLIDALANLRNHVFELWIVGIGPEEAALRNLAKDKLDNRVRWLGQLPLPEVPAVMAQADCLVLPSVHDGWGAVASEALMVGTPVICSSACGVAGVVKASGVGGVFKVNEFSALHQLLFKQMANGPIMETPRRDLAAWANCLNADTGAVYLQEIFEHAANRSNAPPTPPWLRSEARMPSDID